MNLTPLKKVTGSAPRPTMLRMFLIQMIIPPILLMKGKQFVCSTITPQEWQPQHRPLEKCGQNVVKFGEFKKKDLVKCLKISKLQGLVVPRMDTQPLYIMTEKLSPCIIIPLKPQMPVTVDLQAFAISHKNRSLLCYI